MRGHDRKPYAREPRWWEYVIGIPVIAAVMFGMLWGLAKMFEVALNVW